MDLLWTLIDILLHLDRHLSEVIQQYGVWTYLILFLIVFCETGLVVTPFLPGRLAALRGRHLRGPAGRSTVGLVIALLSAAAILGDSVNYAIGREDRPARVPAARACASSTAGISSAPTSSTSATGPRPS